MEKRIVIASIVSIVLILLWGYFMPHPSSVKNLVKTKKIVTIKKPESVQKSVQAKRYKPLKSHKPAKIIGIIKKVSFSNNRIDAKFNLPSGSLYSLSLLKYSYNVKNKKNIVDLSNHYTINQIINFIPASSLGPIKFIGKKSTKNSIEFIYNINGKIQLIKKYVFFNKTYLIHLFISVQNLTNTPIAFNGRFLLSAGLNPNIKNKPDFLNYSPIIYLNNSAITPNIVKPAKYSGNISFAGFNSKYFMLSAVAPGSHLLVQKTDNAVNFLFFKKVLISPRKITNISFKVYGGPKKLHLLDPIGQNISSTLNYGFFSFFSIPLLHVLEFFYKYVHNYGLAIILLVLCIRIIFYPLTYIGFKSMKQMQKLTPKINELREKFKDNKVELNKKIMELYKESKVNPFGGCLPMLLQIPVFYGLYETLLISIQLRNAPFVWWISNLSAPDPYYILPILMGLTMLISQKMNPMMGDPTQAKIMLILPVVFTFLFINFPAGLLLYWTVNNILTIAQQYIINKKFA